MPGEYMPWVSAMAIARLSSATGGPVRRVSSPYSAAICGRERGLRGSGADVHGHLAGQVQRGSEVQNITRATDALGGQGARSTG
jgi:hypothetical protein